MERIQVSLSTEAAAKQDMDEVPTWVVGYAAFGVLVIVAIFAITVLGA